jgi:hypothetical protein
MYSNFVVSEVGGVVVAVVELVVVVVVVVVLLLLLDSIMKKTLYSTTPTCRNIIRIPYGYM